MKFFAFISAILLSVSATAGATEFKCLQTEPFLAEGMNFYLWLEITTDSQDETKIDQVILESLAENGFYGKFPAAGVVGGKFLEKKSLEVSFLTDPSEKPLVLKAKYNSSSRNYVGEIRGKRNDDGKSLRLKMKCMHLKAL